MKLIITVTAVFNFPENTTLVEIEDDENSYGEHILIKGHKIQPIVEFVEYQGKIHDKHTWGEPHVDIIDKLYQTFETEEYSILKINRENEKNGD
jgi:hypothetical protein